MGPRQGPRTPGAGSDGAEGKECVCAHAGMCWSGAGKGPGASTLQLLAWPWLQGWGGQASAVSWECREQPVHLLSKLLPTRQEHAHRNGHLRVCWGNDSTEAERT